MQVAPVYNLPERDAGLRDFALAGIPMPERRASGRRRRRLAPQSPQPFADRGKPGAEPTEPRRRRGADDDTNCFGCSSCGKCPEFVNVVKWAPASRFTA
jgi:hypothetical protein